MSTEQHDVKSFLSVAAKHGSRTRLAFRLGVTRRDVSRRFNPNDEDRKSLLGELLVEAEALCAVDPEGGELLRHYIDGKFETWLRPQSGAQLSLLTSGVIKETSEYTSAHLEKKPAQEQLKEALDIVAAAKRVAQELQVEIARKGAQVATYQKVSMRRRAAR